MIWKSLAVAGSVAAVALIGAAPASASSSISYGSAATGSFASNGEVFTVCDTASDGYGARLDWYVGGSTNSGSVSDTNGNNGVCVQQNASIAEGKAVYYRLCLVNNGATVSCTGYHQDTA